MRGRSVRLSSEDEEKERQVFEDYGINKSSFSDNYRALIRFLHENLHKQQQQIPPPKFEKPDCKHLTEPAPAQFHCVHRRHNAPPHIKTVHLIDCASCKLQERNVSNTPKITLPEPAKIGELPTEETEQYTPIKGFEKILFYVRSDGGKLCPFEKGLIAYRFVCVACEKNQPAKHHACLTLRSSVQSTNTQKATQP